MQPVIGVSTYYIKAYEFGTERIRGRRDQDAMLVSMDYAESISLAGGTPMAIAPINSDDYLQSLVASIDGLVLSGGGDINPRHYNQSIQKGLGTVELERDIFELKLLSYAMQRQLPIFGICRGIQLLNVYFKGTLFQDISRDTTKTINHAFSRAPKSAEVHRVDFVKDCAIKDCYSSASIYVNSLHHQAIDQLGDGLSVCAKSEDGYIEAVQYDANPAVFGVQWHPEMMTRLHPEQLNIFKLLVGYARDYKKQR